MPVQIGAKSPTFSDPTGLLSDCHRRIEMFLGMLAAVGERIDQPITDETRRALESALRYFGQAAPKHTADEEVSLFPRLRQMNDPDMQSAFAELDKLESDHRWAEPLHAEVERLGVRYLDAGQLSVAEVESYRTSVARLVSMYKHHLSVEDELIFPLAKRLLSEKDNSAIANEMADRRQVKLVTDLA
ncbi:MAG: hemerythrin domain-containing protein [Acidobacteriaceae bacterium]